MGIALAFILFVLFTGCEKDYFIAEKPIVGDNPIFDAGTEFSAGFSWSTIQGLNLSVDVDDVYGGKYYYVVEVYDANPLFNTEAVLLSKGVAKQDLTFCTQLVVPTHLNTLHIKQINPAGLVRVQEAEVNTQTVKVNFSEEGVPSKSVLRGAPVGVGLSYPTLPTSIEINASSPATYSLQSNVSYVIRGNYTGNISFPAQGNTSLYVEGMWTNTATKWNLGKNTKIVFQNGAKFESNQSITIKGASDVVFFIASLAECNLVGKKFIEFDFTSNEQFINLGEAFIQNLSCTNSQAAFYNAGELEVGGVMNIKNVGKFVNDGYLSVYDGVFNDCVIQNNCLIYLDKAAANKTTFNLSEQTLLKVRKMPESKQCGYNLDSKSKFEVIEKITFYTPTNGVNGVGLEKAVASFGQVEFIGLGLLNYRLVYSGKLNVETSNHQNNTIWATYYQINAPAYFTPMGESDVSIPSTECNGGGKLPTTGNPPAIISFPITYSGQGLTYMFEDNWPYLGDYDMNDLVLDIVPVYQLNKFNLAEKLVLDITLRAVGASKNLAVGLQLDNLNKSKIQSVTRSNNLGITGNVFAVANGLETNQSKPVIPLFDNVHQAFNVLDNGFINTKHDFTLDPVVVSVAITFTEPIAVSQLGVDNFNLFIVNGEAKKKRQEVHLVGFIPTDKADNAALGFADVSETNLYRSHNNMIWAMAMPAVTGHSYEGVSIAKAYPKFKSWVLSNGEVDKAWYVEPNAQFIYAKP